MVAGKVKAMDVVTVGGREGDGEGADGGREGGRMKGYSTHRTDEG